MKPAVRTIDCQAAYLAGRTARQKRVHKNNCPHPWATQIWAWWLAGWNDEDIENGSKKLSANE